MATRSRARQKPAVWSRTAILAGSGLGVVLFVILVGLYMATPKERIEKFGLSALLEGPDRGGDQVLTPLEAARARFNERYHLNYESKTRPEISGTKLMLRAISEFNERERSIIIDDAVRLLHDHPDAKPQIFALVDQFLENNPHMAEHGQTVKSAVEQQLAQAPTRNFGLDY